MNEYQQCNVCKCRYAMWYTKCPNCNKKDKK